MPGGGVDVPLDPLGQQLRGLLVPGAAVGVREQHQCGQLEVQRLHPGRRVQHRVEAVAQLDQDVPRHPVQFAVAGLHPEGPLLLVPRAHEDVPLAPTELRRPPGHPRLALEEPSVLLQLVRDVDRAQVQVVDGAEPVPAVDPVVVLRVAKLELRVVDAPAHQVQRLQGGQGPVRPLSRVPLQLEQRRVLGRRHLGTRGQSQRPAGQHRQVQTGLPQAGIGLAQGLQPPRPLNEFRIGLPRLHVVGVGRSAQRGLDGLLRVTGPRGAGSGHHGRRVAAVGPHGAVPGRDLGGAVGEQVLE